MPHSVQLRRSVPGECGGELARPLSPAMTSNCSNTKPPRQRLSVGERLAIAAIGLATLVNIVFDGLAVFGAETDASDLIVGMVSLAVGAGCWISWFKNRQRDIRGDQALLGFGALLLGVASSSFSRYFDIPRLDYAIIPLVVLAFLLLWWSRTRRDNVNA